MFITLEVSNFCCDSNSKLRWTWAPLWFVHKYKTTGYKPASRSQLDCCPWRLLRHMPWPEEETIDSSWNGDTGALTKNLEPGEVLEIVSQRKDNQTLLLILHWSLSLWKNRKEKQNMEIPRWCAFVFKNTSDMLFGANTLKSVLSIFQDIHIPQTFF